MSREESVSFTGETDEDDIDDSTLCQIHTLVEEFVPIFKESGAQRINKYASSLNMHTHRKQISRILRALSETERERERIKSLIESFL